MAPHLLQWEAIKLAKKEGCKYYDLFGIAPRINNEGEKHEYDKRHMYAGVTRFKLGFGGMPVEYPGTFDIKIRRYFLYNLLRKFRRLVSRYV